MMTNYDKVNRKSIYYPQPNTYYTLFITIIINDILNLFIIGF